MGFSPEIIHIHIEEIDLKQVPFQTNHERTGTETRGKNSTESLSDSEAEKDLAQKFEGWLRGVWKAKDDLMTRFYAVGNFTSPSFDPASESSRIEASSTSSSNLLSSSTGSGGGTSIDWDPKISHEDLFRLGRVVIPMLGLWSYVIWIAIAG